MLLLAVKKLVWGGFYLCGFHQRFGLVWDTCVNAFDEEDDELTLGDIIDDNQNVQKVKENEPNQRNDDEEVMEGFIGLTTRALWEAAEKRSWCRECNYYCGVGTYCLRQWLLHCSPTTGWWNPSWSLCRTRRWSTALQLCEIPCIMLWVGNSM